MSKQRNFGLDVVRTISIWMVLIYHLKVFYIDLSPLTLGLVGVEVFFVLSGFLIGAIIFKDLDKNLGFFKTITHFWKRRWYRILPLYYFILLFKFVLLDHSIGWNILYYVFFLQNNFFGVHYFSVSWSLVIEEWFYLFSPIFLFIVYRSKLLIAKALWLILLFILFVNLARFGYVIIKDVPYGGVNGNVPFRFDSLFYGVLLAFLKHKKSAFYSICQKASIHITGLGLFLGYLLFVHFLPNAEHSIFVRTFGFTLLPLSIALTVPFIENAQFSLVNSKAIRKLIEANSKWTYAIYLTHVFAFKYFLFDPIVDFGKWPNTVIALAVTFMASGFGYHFVEKPFLKLRDKSFIKK